MVIIAQKKNWLEHLNHAVPLTAYGIPLSLYTVALEGWRRGLTLKFFHKHYNNKWNLRFTLKSDKGREREFVPQAGT